MVSLAELEKLASDLPDSQRATLEAHLLGSLPPILDDADEGVTEARRRDAEMDANPCLGLSLEQLDQQAGIHPAVRGYGPVVRLS